MMLPQTIKNKIKKDYGSDKIYIHYGTKYIDYSFLNDGQKVQVPVGYNSLEDFIDKENSKKRNQHSLIIYYSVNNKKYQFDYSPQSDITQSGMKGKIVNDMKKTIYLTLA